MHEPVPHRVQVVRTACACQPIKKGLERGRVMAGMSSCWSLSVVPSAPLALKIPPLSPILSIRPVKRGVSVRPHFETKPNRAWRSRC